jgi:hypothetical protein
VSLHKPKPDITFAIKRFASLPSRRTETTHLDSGIQLARTPRALYNPSAQFEAEVKRPLGDAEVAAAPNFFPRQIAPLTGRILRKVSGEVLQETLKKYEKLRILALRGPSAFQDGFGDQSQVIRNASYDGQFK